MGYPQQNWQGYPQQGYPGPGYPAPEQGSPALAVITGVIGLGIAGMLTWQTLDLMSILDGVPVPDTWTVMNIAHFAVAGILLLGAVLVFARLVAGAVILMIGAALTLAALLTAPLYVDEVAFSMFDLSSPPSFIPTGEAGDYYRALFEFANTQGTLRFIALVLGVILLITALLPPSLNWLRRPRQNGYSTQQPGW
jgi:hypothetical protein